MTEWRLASGGLVSCREKLRTLEENEAEVRQVLRDAFEDAVLMGVDEGSIRGVLEAVVAGLVTPKRAG